MHEGVFHKPIYLQREPQGSRLGLLLPLHINESLSLSSLYPRLQPHSALPLPVEEKQVQLALSSSQVTGSLFVLSIKT